MQANSGSQPKSLRDTEEPPPVLGTWRRVYAVVIVNTILVYLALLFFSAFAAG